MSKTPKLPTVADMIGDDELLAQLDNVALDAQHLMARFHLAERMLDELPERGDYPCTEDLSTKIMDVAGEIARLASIRREFLIDYHVLTNAGYEPVPGRAERQKAEKEGAV